MANRNVLAIGASAGGIDALLHLARNFAPDFPASVLVTLHLSAHFRSSIDAILGSVGQLATKFASDGERAERATIYLAPPDRHLLIDDDRLWLGSGPRENNSRPAIDPMLRSVAACCGSRSVGVVLTGTLGDGASGLWSVAECGGCTVVQDPKDAAFSDMPVNALARVKPDHILALAEMPAVLDRLARRAAGTRAPVPPRLSTELNIARGAHLPIHEMDQIGRRSALTCPDCHGAMWEINEGDVVHYRCHVGHAYTAELMSLALDDGLRRALGTALRTLEERATLAGKLQRDAEARRQPYMAASWAERAAEFQEERSVVEGAIQRMDEIAALRSHSGGAKNI